MTTETEMLPKQRARTRPSRPSTDTSRRPTGYTNSKVVVPSEQPLPVRKATQTASETMATSHAQQMIDPEVEDGSSDFELQPDVFEEIPEAPKERAEGDQDGFEQSTVVALFKKLNYDPPIDEEYDGRRS